MANLAEDGPSKGKLVVKNIGTLLSGALEQPILDADTIVAVDGRIPRSARPRTSTPSRRTWWSTPRARRWRPA